MYRRTLVAATLALALPSAVPAAAQEPTQPASEPTTVAAPPRPDSVPDTTVLKPDEAPSARVPSSGAPPAPAVHWQAPAQPTAPPAQEPKTVATSAPATTTVARSAWRPSAERSAHVGGGRPKPARHVAEDRLLVASPPRFATAASSTLPRPVPIRLSGSSSDGRALVLAGLALMSAALAGASVLVMTSRLGGAGPRWR
jgi:hypothetical protein